ncbi:FecR family protein [Pseudomonas sp. DTU_2021_1001937_2_SI_NGA_ILE_001]|uniref:FecR family protein n=1 Tax=Pseudomonas sp. DTU_2021_1001937_2_SI_NGA_ILE_001 TaxID=3077589 RepID=UPI0028FC2FBA|nr:FecR family protein [Pseudomonas sp. DTU_2021_1001937_2_SI_NGA_ILE_001]WNW11869.1 FecR family protein [Pseudomonas sp. DTU_2021_1001937_2_SI_NGA_ILE_001]
MSSQLPQPVPDQHISDQAAHWCMRLHEADFSAEERAQLERWLASDPLHRQEFEAMQEIWALSEFLPPTTPAPPRAAAPVPAPRRASRRLLAIAATLAVSLPLAGLVGWNQGWIPDSYHRYASQSGLESVTLADGSEVQMNCGTRLSFANYQDRRSVTLSKGEAFFKVTHDAQHPFVVNAGQGQIQVTGTQFNVWTYGDSVVVTLSEGSVRVLSDTRTPEHVAYLSPGMQARYDAQHGDPQVAAASLDNALAWRNGRLVLDNLTLAEALPQINRYLETPVHLADKATAQLRIGGVYSTRDIDGLVQALPRVLPVVLTRNNEGQTVIARKSG